VAADGISAPVLEEFSDYGDKEACEAFYRGEREYIRSLQAEHADKPLFFFTAQQATPAPT
jgi:hypothetical protein